VHGAAESAGGDVKRGTPSNPKLMELAEYLGCRRYAAAGILELLWHFAARHAPQGDVGKWSNQKIAAGIGWPVKSADRLIKALIDARWLDETPTCRLVVHDWHEHCEFAVDKYLASHRLRYANGEPTRSCCKLQLVATGSNNAKLVAESYPSLARASEPEPEPEPDAEPDGGLRNLVELFRQAHEDCGSVPEMVVVNCLRGFPGADAREAIEAMGRDYAGQAIRSPDTPQRILRRYLSRSERDRKKNKEQAGEQGERRAPYVPLAEREEEGEG